MTSQSFAMACPLVQKLLSVLSSIISINYKTLQQNYQNYSFMPFNIPKKIYKWLLQLSLIKPAIKNNNHFFELHPHDELYLQNGFLLSNLLKVVLSNNHYDSQSLQKIRKIAYLSSNENWQIIREYLEILGFNIKEDNLQQKLPSRQEIAQIFQFLYDQFSEEKTQIQYKKQRPLHIEVQNFSNHKQLQMSNNLLEFILLSLIQVFQISLSEAMGLLVNNGQYLKHILSKNCNYSQLQNPIQALFILLKENVDTLNDLFQEQSHHSDYILDILIQGVLSEQDQVVKQCCQFFSKVDAEEWKYGQGKWFLLKSPHLCSLDLVIRIFSNNLNSVFHKTLLRQKLSSEPTQRMKYYTHIIKLLPFTIFSKQILSIAPVEFFLQEALDQFDQQQLDNQPYESRIRARQLISEVCINYWNRIPNNQRTKIIFSFSFEFCRSITQKYHCVTILLHILNNQLQNEQDSVQRWMKILLSNYKNCKNTEIRQYIMDNLKPIFLSNVDNFPLDALIKNYHFSSIAQSTDYDFLLSMSQGEANLMQDEVLSLLKICNAYYLQQIHCENFKIIIELLIQKRQSKKWAENCSTQILSKWTTLDLPKLSSNNQISIKAKPTGPNNKRLRSIGAKLKQMLIFNSLNRFKDILNKLSTIDDLIFLNNFLKRIKDCIKTIEKGKKQELLQSSKWIKELKKKIEYKIEKLSKKPPNDHLENLQIISEQQNTKLHQEEEGELNISQSISQAVSRIAQQPEFQLDSQFTKYETQGNQFINENEMDEIDEFLQQKDQPTLIPLLPYSDQSSFSSTFETPFNLNLLEQHEIIFLNSLQQKYSQTISKIAEIYISTANITQFLKQIQLGPFNHDQTARIIENYQKIKLHFEKVEEVCFWLLSSIGMQTFNFKRGRRVQLFCLNSYFSVLKDKINEKNNSEKKQKQAESICRRIEYQHQITKQLKKDNNSIQSFLVCFEMVSDILSKALKIHEIQPVSKMVIQADSNIQKKALEKSKLIDIKVDHQEQEQLKKLQQKVNQQLQNNQLQRQPSSKIRTVKTTTNNDNFIKDDKSNNKLDKLQKMSELRNKIGFRRKELEKKIVNQKTNAKVHQKTINDAPTINKPSSQQQ